MFVALVLAPGAAHAADASAFSPPFVRLALGLVLCSALALAAALALRSYMHKGPTLGWRWASSQERSLAVLESYRLSQHADVCRIASGETEYLIVVSPGAATVLESKPRGPLAHRGDAP